MKTINKKNPLFAGALSLFLGPIGYVYLGFNFLVAGISIALIIGIVLSFLNFPYPGFFNYLQLLVWAYFGYKFAHISNVDSCNDVNRSILRNSCGTFLCRGFLFARKNFAGTSDIVFWYRTRSMDY